MVLIAEVFRWSVVCVARPLFEMCCMPNRLRNVGSSERPTALMRLEACVGCELLRLVLTTSNNDRCLSLVLWFCFKCGFQVVETCSSKRRVLCLFSLFFTVSIVGHNR